MHLEPQAFYFLEFKVSIELCMLVSGALSLGCVCLYIYIYILGCKLNHPEPAGSESHSKFSGLVCRECVHRPLFKREYLDQCNGGGYLRTSLTSIAQMSLLVARSGGSSWRGRGSGGLHDEDFFSPYAMVSVLLLVHVLMPRDSPAIGLVPYSC